ncbi:hypothetical protein NIES4106_62110 (plasmid) [Fischerella sp. NIES-4106]|nr:hypothetical protein NIES4106_62110 [Fischerella sp. NIES-4106]
MERKTYRLPDQVINKLSQVAQAQKTTPSAIVRNAIKNYLSNPEK